MGRRGRPSNEMRVPFSIHLGAVSVRSEEGVVVVDSPKGRFVHMRTEALLLADMLEGVQREENGVGLLCEALREAANGARDLQATAATGPGYGEKPLGNIGLWMGKERTGPAICKVCGKSRKSGNHSNCGIQQGG